MNQNVTPVRKIKSSRVSLRGKVLSSKDAKFHDFESSLERDFIEMLEFDANVIRFVEQPVTIEYQENGIRKSYTPDFLVTYRDDVAPADKYSPLLCEVKYSKELKQKHDDLQKKFYAAENFAAKKGWRFRVLTELEIRTDYLKNVKFLSNYKDSKYTDINDFALLLSKISALRVSTPAELLLASTRCEERKPELLFTLWHMIANGFIACDLNIKLTMKSEIWNKLAI
jgi:hypothetical protein